LYLIELKGENLRDAAEQLLATLSFVKRLLPGCSFEARIVLSRVKRPDLPAASVVALERQLAKLGGRLIKATRLIEEAI